MENLKEMFTEEELKILNFSEEEANAILDADALARTADMLPDEPDALLNRIDKEFPDDAQGVFDKMAELEKTDPEFVKQLLALNEVVNEVKEVKPSVQKVDVKAELNKESIQKIKDILRK